MEGKSIYICHVKLRFILFWVQCLFVWLRHDAAESIGLTTFPTQPSSSSKVTTLLDLNHVDSKKHIGLFHVIMASLSPSRSPPACEVEGLPVYHVYV